MRSATKESQESIGFYVFLTLATIVFLSLFVGLYKPVLWAAVFALLFRPVYLYFYNRFEKRQSLAAAVTVVLVLFIVILPSSIFALAVGKEAASYADELRSGAIDPSAVFEWFANLLPSIRGFADTLGVNFNDIDTRASEAVAAGSEFIASKALDVGKGLVRTIFSLLLMHYLLFYFLKDGLKITRAVLGALPLGEKSTDEFAGEIADVSKATIKGLVIIGLIQGAIGTVTFFALGVRGAALWGVAMAVSSLVPVIGTSLVWVPAALVLVAAGHWVKAVILIAVGAIVIGLVDNLLRPVLIGHDTRIPDYLVLLSTLGALGLFGLTGFIIGPLIAAIFLAAWRFHLDGRGNSRAPQRRVKSTSD
jgi:predicted PurR-regulated permease PerM